MEEINIPKPAPEDDYQKTEFAIEVAFNALVAEATKLGLKLNPVMGLMYLPDERLTTQFQEACRAVLVSLAPSAPPVP